MSSHETGLPYLWEVRHSNSKNLPYYFNASTKESRWEPPSGTDPEKIKTYMAIHHSTPANPLSQLQSQGSSGSTEGKIRAAHLLVKHKDSRRPSSWKEPQITRSKEEAFDILKEHEKRIKSGDIGLGDLATSESDCSSARKKGDLGFFGHGDMQKKFEQAAFALKPGEVSGLVDTDSGVHLIERYGNLHAGTAQLVLNTLLANATTDMMMQVGMSHLTAFVSDYESGGAAKAQSLEDRHGSTSVMKQAC